MPDSDFYERMIEQLSYQELGDMLDSQIELRKVAEKMAREARDELERVAIALVPAQVDDYRYASPEGIGVLDIAEIAELLVSGVQEKLRAVPDRAALREKQRVITRLREENRKLQVEVRALEARVARLAQSDADLEPCAQPDGQLGVEDGPGGIGARPSGRESERVPESSPPAKRVSAGQADPYLKGGGSDAPSWPPIEANRRDGLPPWVTISPQAKPIEMEHTEQATWPGWVRRWHEGRGNFSRDCDTIAVIGDTGLAQRQAIGRHLARWWDLKSPSSGSISRAFMRLEMGGGDAAETKGSKFPPLVEVVRPNWRKLGGAWRVRHLVRLTERGQDAYRMIRGKAPVRSQTTELLRRHKSPEHAALNIKAAELLWRAGYSVDVLPDPMPGDDWTYYPDLVITHGKERLYVECERMTHKDGAAWGRKGDICHQATDGHLCVVTPTERDRHRARIGILDWAGQRSLTLWMASIEGLKMSEGDVWAVVKAS